MQQPPIFSSPSSSQPDVPDGGLSTLRPRAACRTYVVGPLQEALSAELAKDVRGAGHIEVDPEDPDGQTLLVWYPEVKPRDESYVRPAVRIESGAKSALDPNRLATIRPYIADDMQDSDLTVADVTTIEPSRTFWDKVVIARGLRRWYERRGVLRQESQRVSRHYYDLHCLMGTKTDKTALTDFALAADCVAHARMFFNRADYDLASARTGSFAIEPTGDMIKALQRDYVQTAPMIFGAAPKFDEILASVQALDRAVNRNATA